MTSERERHVRYVPSALGTNEQVEISLVLLFRWVIGDEAEGQIASGYEAEARCATPLLQFREGRDYQNSPLSVLPSERVRSKGCATRPSNRLVVVAEVMSTIFVEVRLVSKTALIAAGHFIPAA